MRTGKKFSISESVLLFKKFILNLSAILVNFILFVFFDVEIFFAKLDNIN